MLRRMTWMSWLLLIALFGAAVSIYYYFRVIQSMYFKEGEAALQEPANGSFKWLLMLMAALVIAIGIFPQLIFNFLYF